MVSYVKSGLMVVILAASVNNCFGVSPLPTISSDGEPTFTFEYGAGRECAYVMVVNLIESAKHHQAEQPCISEFLKAFTSGLHKEGWRDFLEGFDDQFRSMDIKKAIEEAKADPMLSQLLEKGDPIIKDLFPIKIEGSAEWSIGEPTFESFAKKALMKAAEKKYGVGSEHYKNVDYIVKTYWERP